MLVPIGRFGRPHGVRGDIRFWAYNPESDLLKAPKRIEVGPRRDRLTSYRVETIRFDAKGCVVRLAEFSDRDLVGRLTNQLWFEPRDSFASLGDDEIYFADLIGMVVRTEAGVEVGHVKDVLDEGPSDILVIDRAGREVMLPNVDVFVRKMDLEAGEIIVTPPAGLIDGI